MNSLYRIKAVMVKEFRQLSRDRITFGMVVMIPLIQLILFGFASTPMFGTFRWQWLIKASLHLAAC